MPQWSPKPRPFFEWDSSDDEQFQVRGGSKNLFTRKVPKPIQVQKKIDICTILSSDDEDEDEEESKTTRRPIFPRKLPQKFRAGKVPREEISISSDDDDDSYEISPAAFSPSKPEPATAKIPTGDQPISTQGSAAKLKSPPVYSWADASTLPKSTEQKAEAVTHLKSPDPKPCDTAVVPQHPPPTNIQNSAGRKTDGVNDSKTSHSKSFSSPKALPPSLVVVPKHLNEKKKDDNDALLLKLMKKGRPAAAKTSTKTSTATAGSQEIDVSPLSTTCNQPLHARGGVARGSHLQPIFASALAENRSLQVEDITAPNRRILWTTKAKTGMQRRPHQQEQQSDVPTLSSEHKSLVLSVKRVREIESKRGPILSLKRERETESKSGPMLKKIKREFESKPEQTGWKAIFETESISGFGADLKMENRTVADEEHEHAIGDENFAGGEDDPGDILDSNNDLDCMRIIDHLSSTSIDKAMGLPVSKLSVTSSEDGKFFFFKTVWVPFCVRWRLTL